MIPLRLTIKNFLSYGSKQTVDFEPYHLICLSGKNGHGKSALLDALTWVLWGQARKVAGTAKADEGLIHLGETNMMVSLDFTCNNNLYRVRREFTVAPGKTISNLEFGILDTDVLRPFTDKTIRATQAKIEATLGLDYETFINSAFLRQGQSHEFSKKSAKERKDILANILGLDHFENMRRLALDKTKELQQQREASQIRLAHLQAEISSKGTINEQLIDINNGLEAAAQKERHLKATLQEINQKGQVLAAHKINAEKVSFQRQHVEQAVNDLIHQLQQEVKTYRYRSAHLRGAIPTVSYEDERTTLQHELQAMQILAAQKIDLTAVYTAKQEVLRQFVHTIQERYKQEHDKLTLTEHTLKVSLTNLMQGINELEKKKKIKEQELTILSAELQHITQLLPPRPLAEEIAARAKHFERHKAYYHLFVSKAQGLQTQLAAVNHKKDFIHTSPTAQCPLCEQKVTDKTALESKFTVQAQLLHHQLTRLMRINSVLKKVLSEEHTALELLTKKEEQQKIALAQKSELDKTYQKYKQELEQLTQELAGYTEKMRQLNQQQTQLSQENNALTIRFQAAQQDEQALKIKHEVTMLELQIAALPYNPEREKFIHERLQSLSSYAAQQSTFLKDAALQEERKRAISQKCTQVREQRKQLAVLTRTANELSTFTTQEAELLALEVETKKSLDILVKEKEQLIHQKGALEAQSNTIKVREAELKKEQEANRLQSTQAEEYTVLAHALSKDGIQALLIEDAIPEIEHEANILLAKLTDNQAHISIESLKDLKSGKTKETLDIKISDAVGIRPYELFSGGEAFRIDFALRIALSKLLARRSGTPLQTLVIDEGFGSQDEEGLGHIVDALTKIQEDFAKIIIVSHLISLKEQFPIHFFVQKTAYGSTVAVLEHC